MARSPVVATALVDVCHERVPDLPRNAAVADEFVDAVRLHRIAPLAHVLLREARPDIAETLQADREYAKRVHLAACMVLGGLGELLDGIDWAAFKGPVLSESAHPIPGLRSYVDLDVLVGPRDLREVTARLDEAGWIAGDHVDHHHNPDTPGEMHWRSPTGLYVDLHWAMVNMAPVRQRFDIPTETLLRRRNEATLGLVRAPVLDSVDGFVHVCLHAGLSGGHRLLWLLDIDQLARSGVAWDDVVRRARQWGVEAPVFVALSRARKVLDSPVPDDIGDRLGVSVVSRSTLGVADRIAPVPRLTSEESLARLIARSVRPGGWPTLQAIGRKSALHVWHRRHGSTVAGVDDWVPVDAETRRVYLDAVEAESVGGRRS